MQQEPIENLQRHEIVLGGMQSDFVRVWTHLTNDDDDIDIEVSSQGFGGRCGVHDMYFRDAFERFLADLERAHADLSGRVRLCLGYGAPSAVTTERAGGERVAAPSVRSAVEVDFGLDLLVEFRALGAVELTGMLAGEPGRYLGDSTHSVSFAFGSDQTLIGETIRQLRSALAAG